MERGARDAVAWRRDEGRRDFDAQAELHVRGHELHGQRNLAQKSTDGAVVVIVMLGRVRRFRRATRAAGASIAVGVLLVGMPVICMRVFGMRVTRVLVFVVAVGMFVAPLFLRVTGNRPMLVRVQQTADGAGAQICGQQQQARQTFAGADHTVQLNCKYGQLLILYAID